jgi:cytochrome b561
MILRGTPDRYGRVAVVLHWTSAIAIGALLLLGIAAANTTDPAVVTRLLRIHVSLGILVLVLTAARIVWRLADVRPAPPVGQPQWQRVVASFVHTLLYGLIVVLGASGIGVMVLSGLGPILFGGVDKPLPDFAIFRPLLAHEAAAFTLIFLLCAHVGAALHHQFVRRDRLLARMGFGQSAAHQEKPVNSLSLSQEEGVMILSADSTVLTTIERFDVGPDSLDAAVQLADQSIRTAWRNDPAFVSALLLRGTTSGLAVYAQWRKGASETEPATVSPERTLLHRLHLPLVDSRSYELAFTRQASGMADPTCISCMSTPFIHFGVFAVTVENQPLMIELAEAKAPNSFGTPGLLAIDFHRSLDGRQVLNLGAWSTFQNFEALHDRPSFRPGEQYFRGVADMFKPEFYSLARVISEASIWQEQPLD